MWKMSGDHLANGQKTGQGKKAISLFREWFNHKTRAAWSRQEEETRRVSLESLGQHDLANFLLWGFWSQEYENKLPLLKVTYVAAVPGIRHTLSLWLKVRRRSQEVLWEAAGAIGAPLVSPLLLLSLCLHSQTKVFPQNSSNSTFIQFAGKCLGTRFRFPNSS